LANSNSIPWSRISVETVAIVISILLAFSIDAWWDGRKDQLEEREILFGLEVEFVDLRERLDRYAQFNRTGVKFIEQYLSDSVSDMDLRSIESTFVSATVVNVLDQGGAIEALLASGRLEKITDRAIRARRTKWPDWLDDIQVNDLSARNYAQREITPYLSSHGFPATVCPEGVFYSCAGLVSVPDSYLRLAKDIKFRSMLINRRGWMLAVARDHQNAREQADEILRLIKERLSVLDD